MTALPPNGGYNQPKLPKIQLPKPEDLKKISEKIKNIAKDDDKSVFEKLGEKVKDEAKDPFKPGILDKILNLPSKDKTNQYVEIDGKKYDVKYEKNILDGIDTDVMGRKKKPKKYVEIDGKKYEVKTVPDNSLRPYCTIVDEKRTKEVVEIDGKEYDIQNNIETQQEPSIMMDL